MPFLAAIPAVVAAAGIGAGGAILASGISSSSADKASKTVADANTAATQAQTDATNKALDFQKAQYADTRADQAPYRQVGLGALQQLSGAYGISVPTSLTTSTGTTGGAAGSAPTQDWGAFVRDPNNADILRSYNLNASDPRWAGDPAKFAQWWDQSNPAGPGSRPVPMTGGAVGNGTPAADAASATVSTPAVSQASSSDFLSSPDYQFRFNEGLRAAGASAGAAGLIDSGAEKKALASFGSGLASQGYSDWFNHLSTLAGYGQAATSATQAAGTTAATNSSNLTQALGNNVASGITNTGLVQASSYQDAGKTTAGLIAGLGGLGATTIRNLNQPAGLVASAAPAAWTPTTTNSLLGGLANGGGSLYGSVL